ncbi:MAG: DUF2760 domain-containing protein [Rhodospirillales bacterium]
MHRLVLAFRSFFGILFHNGLSDQVITSLGLMRVPERPPAPPPDHIDGTVQILSILQRDSRLIDFLMEDISAYDDEQVGAAVRTLHDQCRDSLKRYVELAPVIDGVEGTFTRIIGTPLAQNPAALVKFIGNVPAGMPEGGVLRHRGWRAVKVDVPVPSHGNRVIAPAEFEIE